MEGHPRITSAAQLGALWQGVYDPVQGTDWSGLLPYYHPEIVFRDSIQEIRGLGDFTAMVERLGRRSRKLEYRIHGTAMEGATVFIEWEMVISYKRYPSSSVYGASRITLEDGLIVGQRDYYDLWGDIFDNIPFLRRAYRGFMRRSFG